MTPLHYGDLVRVIETMRFSKPKHAVGMVICDMGHIVKVAFDDCPVLFFYRNQLEKLSAIDLVAVALGKT